MRVAAEQPSIIMQHQARCPPWACSPRPPIPCACARRPPAGASLTSACTKRAQGGMRVQVQFSRREDLLRHLEAGASLLASTNLRPLHPPLTCPLPPAARQCWRSLWGACPSCPTPERRVASPRKRSMPSPACASSDRTSVRSASGVVGVAGREGRGVAPHRPSAHPAPHFVTRPSALCSGRCRRAGPDARGRAQAPHGGLQH